MNASDGSLFAENSPELQRQNEFLTQEHASVSPTQLELPVSSPLSPAPPTLPDGIIDDVTTNRTQSIHPTNSTRGPWYARTILSIDGGGVKGLTSLLILKALMEEIESTEKKQDANCSCSASPLPSRKRKNESQTPPFIPAHYFDLIVGTSFGGILAIMLGRLRMSAIECYNAYEELVDGIFGSPRSFYYLPKRHKYDHGVLEKALKLVIKRYDCNEDTEASFRQECEKVCRTIVVSFSVTPDGKGPYLLRSYRHSESRRATINAVNPYDENTETCWQVGRATSAAPFYFKTIKLALKGNSRKFLDGGIGTNNPTLRAYDEVQSLYNKAPDGIASIVSIGTGITKRKKSRWRISNDLNTIVDVATDSEDAHARMKRELPAHIYHRFNVNDLGFMKLDSWKGPRGTDTREEMTKATQEYLSKQDVKESMRLCAERLVEIRRNRASNDPSQWEEYCYGVSYSCEFENCYDGHPNFVTGSEFRTHLMTHKIDAAKIEQEFAKGKKFRLYSDTAE